MFSMKLDLNLWSGIRSEPSANWATSTDPSPRPPPPKFYDFYLFKKKRKQFSNIYESF